ncbi:MAG: hypothetical protein EPN84_01895, partial [Legionella sp.]
LDLKEFRNPSGFERPEESVGLQYYNQSRTCLEYFLKKDITQHINPDAQLSAMRRWIMISDKLLKLHNYDAFLLIFTNIQLLAFKYYTALPQCTRELYDRLSAINSTNSTHSSLREYIAANKSQEDCFPVMLWNRSIIGLQENIRRLNNVKESKQSEKKDLIASLENSDLSRRELIHLKNKRKSLDKEIHKIRRLIAKQHLQIEDIIDEIKIAKNRKLSTKPCLQHNSYEVVLERFKNELKAEKPSSVPSTPPNSARLDTAPKSSKKREKLPIPPPQPTLYSKKLLPSFWARKGMTANTYWGQVFTSPNIKEEAAANNNGGGSERLPRSSG